ncbi:MAG: PIG-L family deacetylase [Anaerolineales bacterium]|nr:PIG-L family deacetylase [Anaerolineales bacterium]
MQKRLLAVLAHPDDESFGLGGTLAKYAAAGVDVHIAIATDGVAGSVAEGYEYTKEDLINVRTKEVEAAVAVLGGTLHMLGYRDSGYINDPANNHPEAFINSDEHEAVGRVVALIRSIQPQVVLTHDETGGYYHPDHIHCWKITTAAYYAAGDMQQYPQIGPAPYQPQRLYNSAFPNTSVKIFTLFMRLTGKDPTKIGRNKDIDLTRLGIPRKKLNARIDYREFWDVKRAASAEHPSQGGRGGPRFGMPEWLQRRFMAKEFYICTDPPMQDGKYVKDLFDGVK